MELLTGSSRERAAARSTLEADPDGYQSLQEWFANLSGDAQELQRIGRDKLGVREIRGNAWVHLWELGGEHAGVAEQGLRSLVDEDPNDVVRMFAEDDYVILHTRQEWPADSDWAGVDIFRFDEDDKIV